MKDNKIYSIIPYKDKLIKIENAKKATAYFQNYKIDLLTGIKSESSFNKWIEQYNSTPLNSFEENPKLITLFYELGFLIEKEFSLLDEDSLLVLDIEYTEFKFIDILEKQKIDLELLSSIQFNDYKKAFDIGYQELVNGNCYQFNLTYPFHYKFKNNYKPDDFIHSLWADNISRGAYGSATFIPFYNKLFLSNSPECLFQLKNNILSTMPIKGTIKKNKNQSWNELWKNLQNDQKSQAELYMISDLLRNDLSRIETPSAQIIKNKIPKRVPGLLHQYSQIEVRLSDSVNTWKVISSLFPGGSITGAPKRRAIRLINSLEKRSRGFYCGSTILMFKQMKSASINIRSSVIDFNEYSLLYQAGGGITLLSKVNDEYNEMTYKCDSFISTLTL